MLTQVECVILCAIIARGGSATSLWQLADYAGLAYNNAWQSARRLEARGYLNITKPHKSLVLVLRVTV